MSKVEYKRSLVLNTGNKVYLLDDDTLIPDSIVLFVANSSDEVSAGFSDLMHNFTGSYKYQDESLSKPIIHYRNIGGIKTKTFEATVTGFAAGEVYINVSTLTEQTILSYVVFEK